MYNLERQMLANMDAGPSTWWRYIDDVFAIWPHGNKKLIEFLEKINQLHPSIKFKAEWSAKSVLFLDTKVAVENEGCLTTDLHVKPTDTHQYLHRDSCHSSHCKQGIPYSQALRIRRICSRTEDYLQRTQELKGFLISRGYNEDEIQLQIDRTIGLDGDALLRSKRSKTPLARVPLIVTYHPGLPPLRSILDIHSSIFSVSERLKQVVEKNPLPVAYRCQSKLELY